MTGWPLSRPEVLLLWTYLRSRSSARRVGFCWAFSGVGWDACSCSSRSLWISCRISLGEENKWKTTSQQFSTKPAPWTLQEVKKYDCIQLLISMKMYIKWLGCSQPKKPSAMGEGSGCFLNKLLGFCHNGKSFFKTPQKTEIDIKGLMLDWISPF